MELRAHHEGVVGDLGNFYQAPIGRQPAEAHAPIGKALTVGVVEFEAVAVALIHFVHAVGFASDGTFLQHAGIQSQTHGPAHVCDIHLLGHQVDDRVVGGAVKFGRVAVLAFQHPAPKLHHHQLHAQTQAQVGHFLVAGVADCLNLSFDTAAAKAAGHDHPRGLADIVPAFAFFQFRRVQPADIQLHTHFQGGVAQGFTHAHISIVQFNILAYQRDGQLGLFLLGALHQPLPGRPVRHLARFEAQPVQDEIGHPGLFQHQGHFIEHRGGDHRYHGAGFHVAEQGNLLANAFGHRVVGAGHNHVRRDTNGAQFAHRVLGGFGFQFFSRADHGQPGEVDVKGVFAAQVAAQLPDGLQEGQAFNVAHRAADLYQNDLSAGGAADHCDAPLDLVGDVRNDLDGAAQVVAAPLLADDLGIDLSGGDVAHPVEADVNEALVMAQIQVGLGAVVQHVHLAVLVRAHGAGVDVDVGVQFLNGHRKAAFLEQAANRRGGHAFAYRTDYATGEENIFGCHFTLLVRVQ